MSIDRVHAFRNLKDIGRALDSTSKLSTENPLVTKLFGGDVTKIDMYKVKKRCHARGALASEGASPLWRVVSWGGRRVQEYPPSAKLITLVLPWIGTILTSLPYHRLSSRFLDLLQSIADAE